MVRFKGALHRLKRLAGGDKIIEDDDVLLIGNTVDREHRIDALLGSARGPMVAVGLASRSNG